MEIKTEAEVADVPGISAPYALLLAVHQKMLLNSSRSYASVNVARSRTA